MANDSTVQARAEIKLPDGTVLKAFADRLVQQGRALGTAQENELYYRHIAGISVTRRSGLGPGLLIGFVFLIAGVYVYFQVPEYRNWAFGAIAIAVLAPIIGSLIRTQVYQLFCAGWPGGKWEILANADTEGKLLAAIREGSGKGP